MFGASPPAPPALCESLVCQRIVANYRFCPRRSNWEINQPNRAQSAEQESIGEPLGMRPIGRPNRNSRVVVRDCCLCRVTLPSRSTASPGVTESVTGSDDCWIQPDAMKISALGARVIRKHLRTPTFRPSILCRLVGMSRSSLYRLFEDTGGVAKYIQRERLIEAHAVLTDSETIQSISAIAQDSCFADASSFSRAFKREFGHSPGCRRSRLRVRADDRRGSREGGPLHKGDLACG
jgi:AraC-like DNA-binding protein